MMWGCRRCDWDICGNCRTQRLQYYPEVLDPEELAMLKMAIQLSQEENPDLGPVRNIVAEFKFGGYWWYWDRRDNPFAEGDPDWAMYEDHVSVLVERGYYTWKANG